MLSEKINVIKITISKTNQTNFMTRFAGIKQMYENEKHFKKNAAWIPEYKESDAQIQQPVYE